ncbi:MAG: superoxide dismutase family protein [Lysobacteraceae bacterium]|nr:MAG: superoxide dismutase family protein [Xanthomonadaceae bacterium]
MKHVPAITLAAVAACSLLAACTSTGPATSAAAPAAKSAAQQAEANLASASGSLVSGHLVLRPMGDGVHITGEVGGLKPGDVRGFHIHEKGDCSAADASSAGGHFNPAAQPHGRASQGAHHAGDTDNIVADAKGVARINAHVQGVSLGGGAANDIAGRAVIVHAAADDYATQPTGNAGARVACGVIKVVR